eukprot:scaffold10429_cov126-Cylindrotheca_fusiformis.AAC.4
MHGQVFRIAALLCLLLPSLQGLSHEAVSRRMMLQATITSGVASSFLHMDAASAYPRRDVGDPATRSAATSALNDQAYKTNNRLEQQGFKLDTAEEEQDKIRSAMSSFSYDDATSKKKGGKSKGGSGPSKSK